MNDLSVYIDARLIVSEMQAQTRDEGLRQLVNRLFEVYPERFPGDFSHLDLYEKVLERENIQTTGLGDGIAFPHARVDAFSDLTLIIGLCKEGIDWRSLDDKRCRVICLMVSPILKPYLILQTTAVLVRFLREAQNLEALVRGSSPEQIADTIKASMSATSKTVLARDIMRPIRQAVHLETPIEQATHVMHLNRLDILPVLGEADTLLGEISCLEIFKYGIPDFFSQLQTISFMRKLDPFEKYFKFKSDLTVRDIYSPSANTVAKDTTLMEIVFEMTTKNKLKLFVLDAGRLIGAIDRFSIIDKVLFF